MFVFGLCISPSLSLTLSLSVTAPALPGPLFDCVNGSAVGYVFAASAHDSVNRTLHFRMAIAMPATATATALAPAPTAPEVNKSWPIPQTANATRQRVLSIFFQLRQLQRVNG